MSRLLLLRSEDDVRSAVEAASEFLVYRRRRTILDSLLGTASASRSSSATETFFPVFAAADAVESIKATMSELAACYPQISGGTWYLDDLERGIVPAQG